MYNPKNTTKIKVDYESGRLKKMDMSKKWKISRQGLDNLAKREGWKYAIKLTQMDRIIEEKAVEKIIETESKKLIDYTTQHLKDLHKLRQLSSTNSAALNKAVKQTKNEVAKNDSDRLSAFQRAVKMNVETIDIIYKSERLAMGLDKDKDKERDNGLEERIALRMAKLKA